MENKYKKLNKEKIKQYKKQLKSEKFDVDNEIKYNEKEEAIVECKIDNINNIFSPYDISKDRTIIDSFDEYLMEETNIIPLRDNLEFKIHVDQSIDAESQCQIKNAIKRYYSFKITQSKVQHKKYTLSYIILYIIGILALFVMPFVNNNSINVPLYEVLLVLIWFCLWEASDILLFKCGGLRQKQINMLRIYNANFTFITDQAPTQTSQNLTKTKIIE